MWNLVEPVALVAWSLILASLMMRRRGIGGGPFGMVVATTVFYLSLSTPLGGNLMVRAVEGDLSQSPACVGGSSPIVVLAGGVSAPGRAGPPLARLKESTFRRTVAAVDLASRLGGSVVVVSGGAGGEVTEAYLMRELAVDLGTAPERITSDTDSRSTCESASLVARLLREDGVTDIHLVTSALHMRRAAWAFEEAGLRTCRHPVDSKQVPAELPGWLIPQISALEKSTEAIRETAALVWYRAGGCPELGLDRVSDRKEGRSQRPTAKYSKPLSRISRGS